MTTPAQNPDLTTSGIESALRTEPARWNAPVCAREPLRKPLRQSLRGIQIQSTGLYTPPNCVTNADLAEHGYESDWVFQRTGISSRFIAGPEEATSDMAYHAGKDCLRLAGVRPEEVDFIILATMTSDHATPTSANIVQARLGCTCPAIDVNSACSGFLYAMIMGSQFLLSGCARKVLVIGAEKTSLLADPENKKTFPLFGDGAGAVLLGMNEDYTPKHFSDEELAAGLDSSPGILAYRLASLGECGDKLVVPGGGSREPASYAVLDSRRNFLQMDGRMVFKWAVRLVPEIVNELLEMSGLTIDDIDLLVMHQANRRIIDASVVGLDIPSEKVFVNVDRYGNTSSASIPICLHEAVVQGQIGPGSKVMLVGFGGGLTWGGCLLRW